MRINSNLHRFHVGLCICNTKNRKSVSKSYFATLINYLSVRFLQRVASCTPSRAHQSNRKSICHAEKNHRCMGTTEITYVCWCLVVAGDGWMRPTSCVGGVIYTLRVFFSVCSFIHVYVFKHTQKQQDEFLLLFHPLEAVVVAVVFVRSSHALFVCIKTL